MCAVFHCTRCGKEFSTRISRPRKFCSLSCYFSHRFPKDIASRFWSHVDQSGGPDACWPWTLSKDKDGYGKFTMPGRKSWHAHRVAWFLTNGPIPEGLLIRHFICSNPPCCNPKHLLPGTPTDNMQDCVRQGRIQKGSTHPSAKLTEENIVEIRRQYAAGGSQENIAVLFGIAQTTVSKIVRRQRWTHVK